LTSAGLGTVIPVVGAIAAAIGGGLLFWDMYRSEMKKAEEQAKQTAEAFEKLPKLISSITAGVHAA